ncbi:MAG TPA: recombination regulator RecX [Burkholderiaceae bacterium]|nr:recombination regulator RecX [Burkholderiaceae bacterium]
MSPSRRSDRTNQQRRNSSKSLLSRAIALLARRDHSRAELSRKLARHLGEGDDPAELVRVLDELDRNQLLSDERFAAAVVRSRSQRFGDARIRHDLRRYGVADEVSAVTLATLGGSEVSRAHAVRAKRFTALPTSAAERAKQARFLQSRGFSLHSILRVLRGEANEDGS